MPLRRPETPLATRHAALPLAGSLALHGLAVAVAAALGTWWLHAPPEYAEPPELAVAPHQDLPAVDEAPPATFKVTPAEWLEPTVVEEPLQELWRLDEVEVLLPRPPEPPFPADWRMPAPRAPEPLATVEPVDPVEPPPATATTPERVLVEPPQVEAKHCPPPAYPRAARRLGQEGVVEVLVSVDAQGQPSAVRVLHSSGFPLLDEAARVAVEGWRFHPAHDAEGRAVAGELVVPLRFRLREAR